MMNIGPFCHMIFFGWQHCPIFTTQVTQDVGICDEAATNLLNYLSADYFHIFPHLIITVWLIKQII